MSSRARRLTVATATATAVTPWLEAIADGTVPASGRRTASIVAGDTAATPALNAPNAAPAPPPTAAALEKEIFAKGFAQGEKQGAAAAQQQNAALAKQLATTLEDLMRVRAEMIRHTEKQMVQLALAVARRIVHHGAEFVNAEGAKSPADAFLSEEDWACRVQCDQQRHQQEHRRQAKQS